MILNHFGLVLVAAPNRWPTAAVRGRWVTTAIRHWWSTAVVRGRRVTTEIRDRSPTAGVQGRWATVTQCRTLIRVRTLRAALTAALFLAFASAWAHHGHPHYFRGSYTHMEGTITEVHWLNPHTWVYLQVTGTDGQSTVWALEGAAATTLQREGWTHEMVQVGDTISVRCHTLKDGSPGCLLGYITMENGVEKEFD